MAFFYDLIYFKKISSSCRMLFKFVYNHSAKIIYRSFWVSVFVNYHFMLVPPIFYIS